MRIDGTNGFKTPDAASLAQGAGKPTAQAGLFKLPEETATSALPAEGQAYVAQAAAAPEINQSAVAEARRLLQSGQLSSPDAVRRAAEAILRNGI